MKPCFGKRKLIVWLALGELDARRAQDLRAHLETCAGCHRYLEEISAVGQRLAAAETTPDIEASAPFHQRLVGRLRAEQSPSPWETLAAQLAAAGRNWRVALPVGAAAAVVIVTLALLVRQPEIRQSAQISPQAVPPPSLKSDLSPTVFNYQRAASRSPDELDQLLTAQARKQRSPAPIYTASILAADSMLD